MTDRLTELIDLIADDLASDQDYRELQDAISTSPTDEQQLLQRLQIESLLRRDHAPDLAPEILDRLSKERVVRQVISNIEHTPPSNRPASVKRGPNRSHRRKSSRSGPRRRSAPQPFPTTAASIVAIAFAIVIGLVALNTTQKPAPRPYPSNDTIITALPEPEGLQFHLSDSMTVNQKILSAGNHELQPGSMIAAKHGILTSPDGTRIELNDANIKLPTTVNNSSFELLGGIISCTVSQRHPNNRFRIVTTEGTATVLGTRFVVTKRDLTIVQVEHGRVAVATNVSPQATELTAGQSATINNDTVTSFVHTRPAGHVTYKDITLRVIDGATGEPDPKAAPLVPGSHIDLADYPQGFNILIEASSRIASIRMQLPAEMRYLQGPIDGRGNHRENKRPFAVWGDYDVSGPFYLVIPEPQAMPLRIESFSDDPSEVSIGALEWMITIGDSR